MRDFGGDLRAAVVRGDLQYINNLEGAEIDANKDVVKQIFQEHFNALVASVAGPTPQDLLVLGALKSCIRNEAINFAIGNLEMQFTPDSLSNNLGVEAAIQYQQRVQAGDQQRAVIVVDANGPGQPVVQPQVQPVVPDQGQGQQPLNQQQPVPDQGVLGQGQPPQPQPQAGQPPQARQPVGPDLLANLRADINALNARQADVLTPDKLVGDATAQKTAIATRLLGSMSQGLPYNSASDDAYTKMVNRHVDALWSKAYGPPNNGANAAETLEAEIDKTRAKILTQAYMNRGSISPINVTGANGEMKKWVQNKYGEDAAAAFNRGSPETRLNWCVDVLKELQDQDKVKTALTAMGVVDMALYESDPKKVIEDVVNSRYHDKQSREDKLQAFVNEFEGEFGKAVTPKGIALAAYKEANPGITADEIKGALTFEHRRSPSTSLFDSFGQVGSSLYRAVASPFAFLIRGPGNAVDNISDFMKASPTKTVGYTAGGLMLLSLLVPGALPVMIILGVSAVLVTGAAQLVSKGFDLPYIGPLFKGLAIAVASLPDTLLSALSVGLAAVVGGIKTLVNDKSFAQNFEESKYYKPFSMIERIKNGPPKDAPKKGFDSDAAKITGDKSNIEKTLKTLPAVDMVRALADPIVSKHIEDNRLMGSVLARKDVTDALQPNELTNKLTAFFAKNPPAEEIKTMLTGNSELRNILTQNPAICGPAQATVTQVINALPPLPQTPPVLPQPGQVPQPQAPLQVQNQAQPQPVDPLVAAMRQGQGALPQIPVQGRPNNLPNQQDLADLGAALNAPDPQGAAQGANGQPPQGRVVPGQQPQGGRVVG